MTARPIKRIFSNRPTIGSVPLSVMAAVYVLFATNYTFWYRAANYLSDDQSALIALAVGLSAAFIALFTALSTKYLIKPAFIALVMVGTLASWFTDRFGVVIDIDMIGNAAETTEAEAGHLLTTGFFLHVLLVGIVPSLLIAWIRIEHRPILSKVGRNLALIIPCLTVFTVAGYGHFKTFAVTFREHNDLMSILNPIMPVASAVKYAVRQTEERHVVVQPLGTDARRLVAENGSAKPRVLIVVAGETARAANFALNGYGRQTNPELEKQDITYFPDTVSCGTATAVSLPCMFSVYGRDDYTHEKGRSTENLMDVLTHAGIKAEWWDNNTGPKGIADRIASVNLSTSGDTRFCVNDECQDGIFLDRLDAWLDTVKQDSVLVLHQLGSHGPAYYQRYPEQFRHFKPDCRTAEFSKCTPEEIVNAYDNSILYTDHVLSALIDKLKGRSSTLAGAMVYISDHGESLGENGIYLHGAPYVFAPAEQTHVPFLVWLDRDFAAAFGLERSCFDGSSVQPRSQDNLFHSVLGMMNVSTKAYDRSLDIFAACTGKPSS